MNFRKLLTYLTVGTAAVIPFAGAQNPTILQGSYISNVFGNSNFVLNPNAQTNVANVTNATRSTTTPLVATSEFTLALASGANATWTLRAFDAGMKGQNCEARFSYRGFATATTKAEIVQNSLVVAHLTLTPSTDPRIASINFPCGDLVNATTFRIAQTTAAMTGTNEIGGIYVGLATNMANVAQAEYIGYGGYANGGTISYWDTSTPEGFMAMNNVSTGAVETSSSSIVPEPVVLGNLLRVRFNGLKPGNYHATFTGPLHKDSSTQTGTCSYTITPVTVSGSTVLANEGEVFTYNVTALGQDPNPAGGTLTSNFAVTSTQDVYLYIKVGNASSICRASVGTSTGKRMRFHLHRFPSSSELVVTPERQNWFVGGVFSGGNPDLGLTNTSGLTEITNGSLSFTPVTNSQPAATLCSSTNAPPTLSTSATTCAAGNESIGITYNIPSVGTYEVCAAGTVSHDVAANGNADTKFSIQETATNSATATTSYAAAVNIYVKAASSAINDNKPFRTCQLITYTSVGQKAVRLMFQQVNGGTITTNLLLADGTQGRNVVWQVTPVTNQSNSALYVQGPILGAQTGAAIPEGYVNEFATRSISDTSSRTSSGVTLGTWYYPWTGELTLPAGNWNICYRVAARSAQNRSALNAVQLLTRLENKTDGTSVFENITWPTFDNNTTFIESFLNTHFGCQPISITTSKIFRVGIRANVLLGTPTGVDIAIRGDLVKSELYAIRLN